MTLSEYITFRLPNWTDYARHQCKVQHLEGWAEDLIQEIVLEILRKPKEKIETMLRAETRKILNGRPTTELDKFVLTMIKTNARSHFASFRKNTIGQKIISAYGPSVEVATFCEITTQADTEDETTYDTAHVQQLDRMHACNLLKLKIWGYSPEVIEVYRIHFIEASPPATKRQKMIINEIINHLKYNENDLTESNEDNDFELADYSERFKGA